MIYSERANAMAPLIRPEYHTITSYLRLMEIKHILHREYKAIGMKTAAALAIIPAKMR